MSFTLSVFILKTLHNETQLSVNHFNDFVVQMERKKRRDFIREVWKEVPSRPPRVVTPDRPPRVVAPDRPPLPSPFRGMRPTEKRLVV